MEQLRSEQIGVRTTQSIRQRVEEEARERRWSLSDVVHFALEERYGLAPELPAPAEQPPATEARQ